MSRRLRRLALRATIASIVSTCLFGQPALPVKAEDEVASQPWTTRLLGENFYLAAFQEPDTEGLATQPFQPYQPSEYRLSQSIGFESRPESEAGSLDFSDGIAGVVSGNQAALAGNSDLASFIADNPNIQSVGSQQRSVAAFDPRVRGFHIGQVYAQANGEYFMPVRNDLDSMLSKLDPSLVENIEVIPGPYSARLGPGFAFIDITTVDTPRYDCWETHGRTGFSTRTNGGQVYGYQTFMGGNANHGYIFNYSNRTGSDYEAGNGLYTPASYHSQNFLGQYGFNLSPDAKIELRYNRMDMTNAEFPLQFFDVNYMGTDSFSTTYTSYDWETNSKTRLDGWYNRTRFYGDTLKPGKLPFPGNPNYNVINRVTSALSDELGSPDLTFVGNTNGDLMSSGARLMRTYGDDGDRQLRVGADVRYLQQQTTEIYNINGTGVPTVLNEFYTNQPRSTLTDPGLFTEIVLPSDSFYKTTLGGRVDIAMTNAQGPGEIYDGLRPETALLDAPESLAQKDQMFSLYMLEDVQLTDCWSAQLGAAAAQRPPTLSERYSDGVFLALMQNGFSRVIGRPELARERNYQADVSLKGDFDSVHVRASGFYSFINDYITYSSVGVTDPTGALILIATNTHLATLGGYELYGDVDLSPGVSVLASVQYIRGQDETIDQPLPGIYPISGRLAMRVVDPYEENRWGTELGARIVGDQEQLGNIRIQGTDLTRQVESRTPGFATFYVRGYYNVTNKLNVIAGVDNLLDRTYYEHLNLRLPVDGQFGPVQVLSPGITPYFAVEWKY